MRLRTLKPQLQTLRTQLHTAPSSYNPDATPRTRGRKWMERRAAWLRAHPLCVKCEEAGRVSAALILDHIEPLELGGADDESNYQGLCDHHNKEKTAADQKRIAAARRLREGL